MRVEDRPDKRWGWNDPSGLKVLQDYLIANGARQTRVPDADLFTNDFVAEYNKFDPERIRAQAASYKP